MTEELTGMSLEELKTQIFKAIRGGVSSPAGTKALSELLRRHRELEAANTTNAVLARLRLKALEKRDKVLAELREKLAREEDRAAVLAQSSQPPEPEARPLLAPRDVACPLCAAPPGLQCVDSADVGMGAELHMARVRAFDAANGQTK